MDERSPPRIVKPAEGALPAAPHVAYVEMVVPPKPLVIPGSGSVAPAPGRFAVGPRTGAVLHEIPGGCIDPRTGQLLPR